MVLVVRSVVVLAVPPPSGMVIVRLVWSEAMVRVGVAEAAGRLKAKAVVARERKMITPVKFGVFSVFGKKTPSEDAGGDEGYGDEGDGE